MHKITSENILSKFTEWTHTLLKMFSHGMNSDNVKGDSLLLKW